MDASNLLKPMLGRGELRCIGATTLDEYRKYIEKDPALERRFQQVYVGQPSVVDTIAILRGLKDRCGNVGVGFCPYILPLFQPASSALRPRMHWRLNFFPPLVDPDMMYL